MHISKTYAHDLSLFRKSLSDQVFGVIFYKCYVNVHEILCALCAFYYLINRQKKDAAAESRDRAGSSSHRKKARPCRTDAAKDTQVVCGGVVKGKDTTSNTIYCYS